ncbi:uncharacterized protein LOC121370888 [Gigantopelta aegis]|uniref:uncharacterized protein LOC121370888 n=1 Tax=Gigantopelta aegis TaxID=1735272 RepID=UPI001B887BA1|nr:uncharacterized protein LOC121370888 [Gigantopelta aegis]
MTAMSQCLDKKALITQATLQYKLECKNITEQKLHKEVDMLKMETDRLELERKWCYDPKGERIRPLPQVEAARIAEDITQHPELEEGVLESLRDTRISLQIKTVGLQRELDKLKKLSSTTDCS